MKTTRSYSQIEEVGAGSEFDFLQSSLPKFKSYLRRPFNYAVFKAIYVGQLDLLAYEAYGEEKFWWVIALTNDIVDPWDNSLVGNTLKLPDLLDINDFYNDNFVNTVAFE